MKIFLLRDIKAAFYKKAAPKIPFGKAGFRKSRAQIPFGKQLFLKKPFQKVGFSKSRAQKWIVVKVYT